MSDEHAAVINIDNPELGWVVVGMRTHVAVIPTHEDGHTLGRECWCDPGVDWGEDQEPVGVRAQVPLVTHRDLGEREGLGEITAQEDEDDAPDA